MPSELWHDLELHMKFRLNVETLGVLPKGTEAEVRMCIKW